MTSSSISIIDMPWFCINRFVRISWINSCATIIKLLQWAYLIIIMQCRTKHRVNCIIHIAILYTYIHSTYLIQSNSPIEYFTLIYRSIAVALQAVQYYIETLSTLPNWNNKNFQFPVLNRWFERISFKFTICTQYASIESMIAT